MRVFSKIDAKNIGDALEINWKEVSLYQFTEGLNVEFEHVSKDLQANNTDNDGKLAGEIALAHLKEIPDYYTRLVNMEIVAAAHIKKMIKTGFRFWK